jgi:Fe2+ transport system protein B
MVRQDILGGLKTALEKKQSLHQAMMSFYNAGYKKEEIEEAAKILHEEQITAQQKPVLEKPAKKISFFSKLFNKTEKEKIENTEENKSVKESIEKKSEEIIPVQEKSVVQKENALISQKVSEYGQQMKTPKSNTIIILLVFALLILVGILIGIFLFKKELSSFLNNLI